MCNACGRLPSARAEEVRCSKRGLGGTNCRLANCRPGWSEPAGEVGFWLPFESNLNMLCCSTFKTCRTMVSVLENDAK